MSFLIVDGERYALPIGETTLGGSRAAQFVSSPLAALPPFAKVTVPREGTPTIVAVEDGPTVILDGRPITKKPVSLWHGARIEVAGKRVVYAEMRAAKRSTPAPGISETDEKGLSPRASKPTAATGGQLLPHAGGGPISIPLGGLTIGRDPDNDLVVRSPQASRKHARIGITMHGYVIVDSSTNGVFVNGRRIVQSQRLSRGDVLRFGDEEFRFEADVPAKEFAAPANPRQTAPLNPLSRRPLPEPPTAPDSSPPPRRETRPVSNLLATLEVLSDGPIRGRRFRIESPVVHLGRDDYNEIVIEEDSVAASHAMLAQRNTRWHVTDLGSRSGTFVDGAKVSDAPLPGPCELRVGNVRLNFRPFALEDAGQ